MLITVTYALRNGALRGNTLKEDIDVDLDEDMTPDEIQAQIELMINDRLATVVEWDYTVPLEEFE